MRRVVRPGLQDACCHALLVVIATMPLTAQQAPKTLDAVEMRLAELAQGTAGMMAEYIPGDRVMRMVNRNTAGCAIGKQGDS